MAGIKEEKKIYLVGIYCRLSKDDGTDNESASIATQKSILTDYVKKQGWHIAKTYVDDGYSGTNFQRPSFQNMIKDIESGLINCVITKDLSRLGRNYLDCGLYLEVFFPEHNVRYIAVNDGVDTLNKSAMDITPFRNILNEMYAADISVKIKSAYRARFQQGKFMGTTAPYGYIKDPADHNHLLIDDKVAHVVKEIFDLALKGNGVAKICRHLNKQHILRPAAYAAERGETGFERHFEGNEDKRYIWSGNSVRSILRSPIYAGNLVGYKRIAANMKSKKRPSKLPEEWEVIPNTHEGIVTQEEFDIVQQLITSRRLPQNKGGFVNIFAGVIKCVDCGCALRAMNVHRRKRPEIIDCVQYSCNNYARNGRSECSAHNIEARDLFNAVLADINCFADMAVNDEKAVRAIEKRLTETDQSRAKALEKERKKLNKRLAELDRLFSSLYEDKVMERITERNFEMMSGKYQKEQLEIEAESYEKSRGIRDFLALIRNYQGLKELDATVINALIDKILVSEREKMADGTVKQEIKIYYKFIGFVDELHIIPTKRWAAMPAKNCTVCGVEYVPGSGASRYCPACAKKIRREKSNESKRRSREQKRIACMNCPQKSGDSSTFQVSNMANSKPEIYCKGALKITREKKANSELKYSFPISIENGQIYYGTLFKIIDKVDNGTKVSNSKKTNNELKRTYGLNLEKYSSSKDDLFPKIQWNDVENIKTTQDKKKMTEEIDSGSYVAIFEEESNKYILCRLNKNYMEKDGKISNKFQKDLEDVQDEINAEKDAFIKKHGIKKIDKNGNEYYELVKGSKEEAIYNKKCKDKYLIKKLIKKVNGLSSEEEINEANNIWDSKNKHYSNIFSIETIPINYKINYDEDDEDKEDEHSTKIKAKFCPKITLKKSVIAKPTKNQDNLDEEYFNLFTITKNNTSEKFDIDQAVTTELFFQEQINEIPTTEGEKVIIDKNMTMLYTNGYVSINGKLSGNGQILSGGSIYFKVGTQLNTGLKIEESNNKFALYSKGTIQMGVPKGKGNLTELYEKIRIVLANQSALYTNTIVNRALNQEIELTKKEKARMSETTGNKMSLKECMTKCYGYTSKEAKNFLENIVQKNSYITYNYNNYYYNYRYNMPEKAEDIKIESQYPSTFNGVIYSWGGFKSDAEYNDVLINGVLVTFGADPNYQPGSGEGLNEEELLHLNNGDIKIDNCENFKVIYTSSDINAFMKLCKQEKPIYLTKIYQNILYH